MKKIAFQFSIGLVILLSSLACSKLVEAEDINSTASIILINKSTVPEGTKGVLSGLEYETYNKSHLLPSTGESNESEFILIIGIIFVISSLGISFLERKNIYE